MKRRNPQNLYKTSGFKPSRLSVILILAGLIVAASAAGLLYYRNINRFVFKENMFYITDGIFFDFGPRDRAVIERDGSVSIVSTGSIDIPTQSLPVYYRDRNAILTVRPMSYYSGTLGAGTRAYLLERFSVMEMLEQDVSTSYRKKHYTESGSFLFDGEDTYVFLTEVTLNIGEERSLKLSPLSYVIAVYDSYIMYYDYASGSFQYISFDFGEAYQNVSVEFANGSMLNCDLDVFTADGSVVMLPASVTKLPDYF